MKPWKSYQSSVLPGGRIGIEERLRDVTERFRGCHRDMTSTREARLEPFEP